MNSQYQLVIGNTLKLIQDMQDSSVDLIATDPAYKSLEKYRSVATTTRLTNEWFPVISNEELSNLVHEFYRVLKPNSHCYIMCDQETHYVIRDAAIKCGFTWKKFIVWDKMVISTGYTWRAKHELICYLEKGKRNLNDASLPDVLSHKRIRNGYPTEKPVDLWRDLIHNSSVKGEVMFDPFSGSASSMEAALSLGRNILAFEIKGTQNEISKERLSIACPDSKSCDYLYLPRMQMQLAI